MALGFGWWFGRAEATAPLEDRIPVAASEATGGEQLPTTDQVAVHGIPAVGGVEPEAGSAADPIGTAGTETEAEVPLVVHVIGAIVRPGLVSVPAGSRIDDVVAAAGGPSPEAALDRLNLAAPVVDGMQIRVPTPDDDPDGALVVVPAAAGPNTGSVAADVSADAGPVNLNTASAEQLDSLPGVGPATAAAIMRWREDNGGFHSLEDLLAVPGIGQAKMAAIRDLVTV